MAKLTTHTLLSFYSTFHPAPPSTIPLDITLTKLGHTEIASKLHYSSTHVVGLGLRGMSPHDTKCWLYYPEGMDCFI